MTGDIARHYNLFSYSTFGERNRGQTLYPTSQPARLRSPEFTSFADYQPLSSSLSQSEDSIMHDDDCQSERRYLNVLCR